MRARWLLLVIMFVYGCGKTGPQPVDPTPKPGPVEPIELSKAISEDFSQKTLELLLCGERTSRPDFRYYMAFPSISEKNTMVMFLRIDPSDAAGIKRGPSISSLNRCYYGSYSARFRVPNTLKAQGELGVCAGINLTSDNNTISLEVRLSDPQAVYLTVGEMEDVVRPTSFNANSRFYEYGIDWTEQSIVWWIKMSSSEEKTILKQMENEAFLSPAMYSFNYYYSKLKPVENKPNSIQAPLYAYELELDYMNYTPFNNE